MDLREVLVLKHLQAQQGVGVAVGVGQFAAVVLGGIKRAFMQGEVMKCGQDAVFFQVGDEIASRLQLISEEIEHMGVVAGEIRDGGQMEMPQTGEAGQFFQIGRPQLFALGLNGVQMLQLGI